MIVVVAIILILLGLAAPSVSSMWAERKAAETQMLLNGTLLTGRADAVNAGRQRGLFFMIDDQVQKIFSIESEPYDPANPDDATNTVTAESAANRFRITADAEVSLPVPYRVTPRAIVDDNSGAGGNNYWTRDEIANDDYLTPPTNDYERHRNFFTVIFADDGQLLVRRDVLIHDPDSTTDTDTKGDRTSLEVAVPNVTDWLDPVKQTFPGGAKLANVVLDVSQMAAISFPSVDGLLVYDDAAFGEQVTPTLKRKYLLDHGQPLYLARLSGTVIRGPLGENEP
jgi:type II secretory pathway pseudopilin PulG